jgi:hypothetical protein
MHEGQPRINLSESSRDVLDNPEARVRRFMNLIRNDMRAEVERVIQEGELVGEGKAAM